MDLGEAGRVLKFAVDLVFVTELGTSGAVLFEFHCHLLAVRADAEVDVPEGTAADSFRDAIFRDGGLHCLFIGVVLGWLDWIADCTTTSRSFTSDLGGVFLLLLRLGKNALLTFQYFRPPAIFIWQR